LNKEDAMDRGR